MLALREHLDTIITEKTPDEKVDVTILDALNPLAEGQGRTVELNLNGHSYIAASQAYQANGWYEDGRLLTIIRGAGTNGVLAYVDMGIDCKKRVARCGETRSRHTPNGLGNLSALAPWHDGCAAVDEELERLILGLTLYTLRKLGVSSLEVKRQLSSEDGGGDSDPEVHSTTHYSRITPETRQLIKDALAV